MEQSGADFSVVILDACRNNPFNQGPDFQQTAEANRGASVDGSGDAGQAERGSAGLVEMNASGRTETLVAYATAPRSGGAGRREPA